MDFGMPHHQKHAWNALKKAVNDYAEITGSEVAVVTSYLKSSMQQGAGDAPMANTESSVALHGHGDILRRLRECLEHIKNSSQVSQKNVVGNGWGHNANSSTTAATSIPIRQPIRAEETHHSQAVARSLCSSFQSLKLEQNPRLNFGQSGFPVVNPDSARRGNKRGSRKKSERTTNGEKSDFELDENLLFEQQSDRTSEDDSETDDDDSDDEISDIPRPQRVYGNHHHLSTIHRPPIDNQSHNDPNQFATSLPVNINMNFVQKTEVPRFTDNQGPRAPVVYNAQNNKQNVPTAFAGVSRSRPVQRGFHDTPNPETMMASMQALARSVTDDSALIFGERPRPRINTGESRHVRALH
uniref:uncharacterized protein LOC120333873 n=1 Tax=Styela clava TaxID=7725 RepID=UPI00193970C9|nr:uncharacterized protein LOC120333873 [Styela clava]